MDKLGVFRRNAVLRELEDEVMVMAVAFRGGENVGDGEDLVDFGVTRVGFLR